MHIYLATNEILVKQAINPSTKEGGKLHLIVTLESTRLESVVLKIAHPESFQSNCPHVPIQLSKLTTTIGQNLNFPCSICTGGYYVKYQNDTVKACIK